jgi:hypothetical protein
MKKGTLIAVGAFAILLVAYLATRETQVSVGIKKLEVPELDKTKIHEIDLSGAKTVVFKRDGETWTVEDPTKPGAHAAEDGQVTSLVDAFVETKYQELVTDRRPSRWSSSSARRRAAAATFGKSAGRRCSSRRGGSPRWRGETRTVGANTAS